MSDNHVISLVFLFSAALICGSFFSLALDRKNQADIAVACIQSGSHWVDGDCTSPSPEGE